MRTKYIRYTDMTANGVRMVAVFPESVPVDVALAHISTKSASTEVKLMTELEFNLRVRNRRI